MTISPKARGMIAKLLGMLGTDNDNERANAAAFLKRKLEDEKVSFGDLAEIVRNGSDGGYRERIVYRDRDVYRDRPQAQTPFSDRVGPNPATKVAETILGMAGSRLNWAESRFLNDIRAKDAMTGGNYDLSLLDADKLTYLQGKYRTRSQAPFMRATPRRKRRPVPDAMLDELGLTDLSYRGKSKPGSKFDREV